LKLLVYSLLKLNVIGIALLTLIGFLIFRPNESIEDSVAYMFLGCIFLLFCLNIRTIYRARQAIAASIQNSAVDVAASAIEFRDAARDRVNERLKEREERRNKN